jgi:hypothetical protein
MAGRSMKAGARPDPASRKKAPAKKAGPAAKAANKTAKAKTKTRARTRAKVARPPAISFEAFTNEFASTMQRMPGVSVSVEYTAAHVTISGWDSANEGVDVGAAYERYLKDTRKLDTVMDRLCMSADKLLPKEPYRGWDV